MLVWVYYLYLYNPVWIREIQTYARSYYFLHSQLKSQLAAAMTSVWQQIFLYSAICARNSKMDIKWSIDLSVKCLWRGQRSVFKPLTSCWPSGIKAKQLRVDQQTFKLKNVHKEARANSSMTISLFKYWQFNKQVSISAGRSWKHHVHYVNPRFLYAIVSVLSVVFVPAMCDQPLANLDLWCNFVWEDVNSLIKLLFQEGNDGKLPS